MKRRLWLLPVIILLTGWASAENNPSVMSSGIYKTTWRWGQGDTAEFEGNIICDHVSEDHSLIISLSVDVTPEEKDVSDPYFRYINGKKQSNRHRKSEVVIDSSDQAIRFSGGWELPKDYRVNEATIHLKIHNQNYELIAESELRMINDQGISDGSGYHIADFGNLIPYILIASAVIWILAGIRIIINRRRR